MAEAPKNPKSQEIERLRKEILRVSQVNLQAAKQLEQMATANINKHKAIVAAGQSKLKLPSLAMPGLVQGYQDAIKASGGLTSALPSVVSLLQKLEKQAARKDSEEVAKKLQQQIQDVKKLANDPSKKSNFDAFEKGAKKVHDRLANVVKVDDSVAKSLTSLTSVFKQLEQHAAKFLTQVNALTKSK